MQYEAAEADMKVREYVIDFTRMLFMQNLEIDNMIRNADLKAQLMLGINAILIATLTNTSITAFQEQLSQEIQIASLLDLTLQALTFLALVTSIFYALWTVLPRLRPSKTGRNRYFFGDIILQDEAEYIDRYLDMTLDEVKESIIAQIHAKSFVVAAKFRKVRMSILSLTVGIIMWGALNILVVA